MSDLELFVVACFASSITATTCARSNATDDNINLSDFRRRVQRLRADLDYQRVNEASPIDAIPPRSISGQDANLKSNETAQRELLQKGGMTAQGGITCWRGYGKLGSAKGVKFEKKWVQYCGPKVTYCYAASINPFYEYTEAKGGYRSIMEDFYPEHDWSDNYPFYQSFYILDCGRAWKHDEYKSCPVDPSFLGEYEQQMDPTPPVKFRKVGTGITHVYAPKNENMRRNSNGHLDLDPADFTPPLPRLKYGTELIPNYCCGEDLCYPGNAARGWHGTAVIYTPLLASLVLVLGLSSTAF